MNKTALRVRFAPAPTGMMHLGNVRTALMNFLMAKQKGGTFVLRIEDTDTDRNFDPGAVKIMEDLAWLGLECTEGPGKDGGYGPYFQSQRAHLYQEKLEELISKGGAYRCFCTTEELEKKRQRQIALKQPPRYDRVCLKLSPQESAEKAQTTPFIWRVKLDQSKTYVIFDLSHGNVTFEMKNFTDFPLTRQDGTVTFMFANFVDDMTMRMNCVIRGADHLSNTAGQAALYDMFNHPLPTFWHMPILCTTDGKKLSKRDFGFSLRDLKDAGFLPAAIVNYLAIIGGSFTQEIMSIDELAQTMNFDKVPTSDRIKYDVDKLRWTNHRWIVQTPLTRITELCTPYLHANFATSKHLSLAQLEVLIAPIHQEMVTLADCVQLLAFYFDEPVIEKDIARTFISVEKYEYALSEIKNAATAPTETDFLDALKKIAKNIGVEPKAVFSFVRYSLTGRAQGIGIKELVALLGYKKCQERINRS